MAIREAMQGNASQTSRDSPICILQLVIRILFLPIAKYMRLAANDIILLKSSQAGFNIHFAKYDDIILRDIDFSRSSRHSHDFFDATYVRVRRSFSLRGVASVTPITLQQTFP